MALNSVSHSASNREVPAAKKKGLTLEILPVIKDAQQQHGLRHGDFQRYRSYCTRRLRRIRKSLNFCQGSKHKFVRKALTEHHLTDVRYLYIPLVTAERAWSYAMQLKQEANTEPRKRFHLMRRLRTAANTTTKFEKLCESPKCDARTKLEVKAYSEWMHGLLQFELKIWNKAMDHFRKAQTVYLKLASALSDEEKVLYQQRVDEIMPNVRYCAYNVGDESAIHDLKNMRHTVGEDLAEKLDSLIAQTRDKQMCTLSEVTWRGRSVPVKHEKVRAFLWNVQESVLEVQRVTSTDTKLKLYEDLLLECKDALQILKDDLQTDSAFRARLGEGQLSGLQYLYHYLTYIRLSKTIERNLLLAENLKSNLNNEGRKGARLQDLIRMYENIIQCFTEMEQLPPASDDRSFLHDISCQVLAYKAFRCYYIGEMLASVNKWVEATAMYNCCRKYAEDAESDSSVFSEETASQLRELLHRVEGKKFSAHANSILEKTDLVTQVDKLMVNDKAGLRKRVPGDRLVLVDRLDEYCEDLQLVTKQPEVANFPPDFQAIPCKPLFFDLALNHIELPSVGGWLEPKKGSGLAGMVKGWLWGGSSK